MTSATPGFPTNPETDPTGYAQLMDYLQNDLAWGGAPRRLPVSTEPAVVSQVGSQPHVPVVPTVTSHVGSQPRFTTLEPPNASTVLTGFPP